MTLEDIGIIIGIIVPLEAAQYFIFMNSVDGKIEKELNRLKDERIAELIRANERLVSKNELLKEGVRGMK